MCAVNPNAALWWALLATCRFLSILDMGETVAKHVELDPGDTVGFVLLSHKHVCPYVLAELSSVFPG